MKRRRLGINVKPAADVQGESGRNFPGILSKDPKVIGSPMPHGVVESLMEEAWELKVKSLSATQVRGRWTVRGNTSDASGAAASTAGDAVCRIEPSKSSLLSRRQSGKYQRVCVVGKVELSCKIQVVLDVVADWPERSSEFEVMPSRRPGDAIVELKTPLMGEVRDGRRGTEIE